MTSGAEQDVKTIALETGFSLVGISEAAVPGNAAEFFDHWLARGFHGGMSYLERHRRFRRNPALLLDDARSAICVALNYYHKAEKAQRDVGPGEGRGAFSIHAHGEDYHGVMERMLEKLAGELETRFSGLKAVACVDTMPVSDRTMAIGAGIAWLGKNGNVISPRFGSWIFLGELITNLKLEPDTPMDTLCGDCTLCIDACPTGALAEPFMVDARKCVSYLTIEKRGEIPSGLRDKMGARVYGCDTCQSACPFNDAAVDSTVFDVGFGSPLVHMDLEELTRISDARFWSATENSAIRRCRPEGMRRNARIALDNTSREPD